MLHTIHLLIIGGDFRQLEVIHKLSNLVHKITLVGFEDYTISDKKVINQNIQHVNFQKPDCILLPIPGIQDDGLIESKFSSQKIHLTKEMISQTKADCLIFSGILTPFLEMVMKETNRNIIPLFKRDDMAILNSIPTAEGALMLAMQHTDRTIHNSSVLLLGFGRVGMTVARLFSSVGAKVTVCIRHTVDAARVTEMGLYPVFLKDLPNKVANQNIVINTIPSLILDAEILNKISNDTLILDLASKPGGTDFKYAKEKGIKTLHALGLPAKVAPKTAGQIIASTLIEILYETLYLN